MKWIEFILENFISGTATEVARHIERVANKKGFKPNNHTKMQSVFKLLPEHTRGVSRPESKRVEGIEYFVNTNGKYFLKDDVIKGDDLILNPNKKVSENYSNSKIHITVDSNKSINHNKMLKTIKNYMDFHGIENEVEYRNIDLIAQDKGFVHLYEVKSYEGSEFQAIGQLLYYKQDISTLTSKKIKMYFVSNYEQNKRFEDIFKHLEICHININKLK